MRSAAVLCHPVQGVKAIPSNFRRLALCTAPNQNPELMPGLPADGTSFTLSRQLQYWREGNASTRIFLGVPILMWFMPGWLYRVSIKSTAWFWWPLIHFGVFLAATPKRVANTDQFVRDVKYAAWTRVLRWSSLITFLAFVGQNCWLYYQTAIDGSRPMESMPMPALVLTVVLVGMLTVPWQFIGVLSNAAAWGVYFLTDKAQIKLETARPGTAEQQKALRRFPRIACLSYIGILFSAIYWGGLAGWMVLHANSEQCYRRITPDQQVLIERAYGKFAPSATCRS